MYSPDYVWVKIAAYLESQLGQAAVAAYLEDTEVIDYSENNLVLYSPSELKREIIRKRLEPYIRDGLKVLFDSDAALLVRDTPTPAPHVPDSDTEFSPRLTFGTFITGASNQLACRAALAAARTPGTVFNPLFIYGPSGVGKTHLLHAIASELRRNSPEARIVYNTCEQFVNEMIASITKNTSVQFREKFRRCDVLLIDDIQFIAGKESTQEEFFNTFNALYIAGKQIVITSDRKPGDMITLENRLRSRFEGGLITQILPPDLQTRLDFLHWKADQLTLPLGEDIYGYIAGCITENIRQLEGVLNTLLAYHNLGGMPLDKEHIIPIVSTFTSQPKTEVPSTRLILDTVCSYFSIERQALCGADRKRSVSDARKLAMYLLRQIRHMTLPDIGKEFGRDHTTVLHALRDVEQKAARDEALGGKIADITETIEKAAVRPA